ncbi:sensor histidine kinase [Rhodococcus sp. AW25M09]|uniref:sensor histidine kinase n=1 Tax=Rhodococcus sp. AW25M09 TaxID=1268303 RepID=UPI00034BFA62|nr:sensor histidine kinase [Rhodococcus sp. AW25M09]
MNKSLPIPLNPLRAWISPNWWLAVASLLASTLAGLGGWMILGLLVLAVCALPFALSGVLVFLLTIVALRWMDIAARAGVGFTSGVSIAGPTSTVYPTSWRKFVWCIRDIGLWKSLCYWILRIPVSAALLFLLPSLFLVLPVLAVAPLAWMVTNPVGNNLEIGDRVGFPLIVSVGVAALATFVAGLPLLVTALARLDWWSAAALLGQSPSSKRVDELTTSRARVVDAADAERRRIERDLHDGAQQRLVSVAMSLGQAKSRVSANDDAVLQELLEDAHREAKNAIGEIRTLTRGLHPPILTDRGLDAALSSVAALCAVPVTIEIDPALAGEQRLNATVESTVYFVVSEALTNVSKHANAGHVRVDVTRGDSAVRVTVLDDGSGGAQVAPHGGLAGLEDRLSGIDGTLSVTSPTGGPTQLEVSIPCE